MDNDGNVKETSKEKPVIKAVIAERTNGSSSDDIQKDSQQLQEEHKWYVDKGIVEPPYDLDAFLIYYEGNYVFMRVVKQIATDVAGLGWNYVLKEGQKEDQNELKKIKEFITNINPDMPLRKILRELIIDFGNVGYFCVEVVRNLKGEVSEIYRVPAATVRVHKSKKKYVQIQENKKVWFSKFGLEQKISKEDGEDVEIGDEKAAHEMIFFKNIYQKSGYYGVPDIISALRDLAGLIESGDYNNAFFYNHGVPNGILSLSGEVDDGAVEIVEKFMKTEVHGTKDAHKTLILRIPQESKFDYQAIGEEVKDASFQEFQKACREAVLVAYGMPGERIGIHNTGALGGDTSREANEIYKNAVVEPLQCDIEDIINKLTATLEVTKYSFKLTDLDVTDRKGQAERITKLVTGAILTPNEGRKELGLPDAGPVGDVLLIPTSATPEEVDIEEE